jgi:hypothetical protein
MPFTNTQEKQGQYKSAGRNLFTENILLLGIFW